MKRLTGFLLCLGLLISCRKQEALVPLNKPLEGIWVLTETLADPGDGSGTWQPADASHPLVLAFKKNSLLSGNAFPDARTYSVPAENNLRFVFADGTFIIYNYILKNDTLSISGGGCIEGCGARFVQRN